MNECPCCAVMRGDKPRMKNSLCEDCSSNPKLKTEWSWYEIQDSLSSMWWVKYMVTLVMAFNTVYMIHKGLNFSSVIQIFGMAFSCYVMWMSFKRLDMKSKLDGSRQKMFLLKLAEVEKE